MRICANPVAAIAVYFSSLLLSLVMYAVMFTVELRWLTFIPGLILVAAGALKATGMFFSGPAFATQPISAVLLQLMLLSCVFLQVVTFVGPHDYVPFQSIAVATPCLMISNFFMAWSGECGGIAANVPAKPHATLFKPATEAGLITLRVMNSMTDFALVRVMLMQARSLPGLRPLLPAQMAASAQLHTQQHCAHATRSSHACVI